TSRLTSRSKALTRRQSEDSINLLEGSCSQSSADESLPAFSIPEYPNPFLFFFSINSGKSVFSVLEHNEKVAVVATTFSSYK
ncbi:hypothetical protein ABTC18_20200, partial [Acinetobacter baumannii]